MKFEIHFLCHTSHISHVEQQHVATILNKAGNISIITESSIGQLSLSQNQTIRSRTGINIWNS